MKPTPLFVLLTLVALGLPIFSARALDPSIFDDDAPLTPALAQLFTDLEAIPAGSTVTDAQHATLVADLTALPPGPAAPTAADLDGLAGDFGKLAVAGLVDNDAEYLLALDFDVDPDDADSWLTYIQGDLDYLLNPPPPYDPNDPGDGTGGTFYPVFTAANPTPVVRLVKLAVGEYTRQVFKLGGTSNIVAGARAHLLHWSYAGSAPRTVLKITAGGLPIRNPYSVTITRKSDGASVKVGELSMVDYTVPWPEGSIVISNPGVASRLDSYGSATFDNDTLTQALPDSFDPADLASVALTDATGHVWVSGSPVSGNYVSVARTAALHLGAPTGSTVPTAYANATVQHKDGPSKFVDRFHFSVRHLPAGTTVTLVADGVTVGQFPTTAKGRLIIAQGGTPRATTHSGQPLVTNALPTGANLWNVHSLSLTDAQGNVLLSGSL